MLITNDKPNGRKLQFIGFLIELAVGSNKIDDLYINYYVFIYIFKKRKLYTYYIYIYINIFIF